MKKNWTMRVGVSLLALMLITSCFVGGTFAKYTTSGSGSDTARVAKFGVTVTAEGHTFANAYQTDQEGKDFLAVESGTSDEVVAPGTWGDMVSFTISGTPEVAVRVNCEVTEFELGDRWKDKDGKYYCPLEITVDQKTLKGNSYASADLFEAAVKAEINAYSKTYAPGTELEEQQFEDGLYVSWEWKFEGNDDVKDTYLGNQAIMHTEDGKPLAPTVSLAVKTTVTQID